MHVRIPIVIALALAASWCFAADPLIGTKPSAWHLTDWQNSNSLSLDDLKGKVAVIRWWTAPGCEFCSATAPALNEFHEKYRDQGLAVIGIYHHKSARPLRLDDVKASAERFGFEFPVAIDRDWRTLKEWYFAKGDRDFTSVTFVLDRKGVIRHIHPGGQYLKGEKDYEVMKSTIEKLLAEK